MEAQPLLTVLKFLTFVKVPSQSRIMQVIQDAWNHLRSLYVAHQRSLRSLLWLSLFSKVTETVSVTLITRDIT